MANRSMPGSYGYGWGRVAYGYARRCTGMLRACSVCGSTKLRMPGFSDGVVPETDNLQVWVCDHDHQMTPLEFDQQADLDAFRRSVGS